jgi:hypothetical protein
MIAHSWCFVAYEFLYLAVPRGDSDRMKTTILATG